MKKIFTALIQAAISIALIWWIFRDPDKRSQMAAALDKASLFWILPGILCGGAALILQTQRWKILLNAICIDIAWLRCLRLVLVGMFFNLFLLGATGGDVVKIYYTMREAPQSRAAAFLSIAVDRIIGILALAIVSAGVVFARFDTLMSTSIARGLVATLVLILGGMVGMVIGAWLISIFHLEQRLPARMPMRRTLIDLAEAVKRYARSPRALAAALLISIPSHLLLFTCFYFAARAFTDTLGLLDTWSVMPIVNTITALPISFGGVGLREGLFEQLLGVLYHIPKAEAVLISMTGYLMMVVWSLVGGVVYLTYRPSDGSSASLREMSDVTEKIAEHPEAA